MNADNIKLTKSTYHVHISPADKAVCEDFIDNIRMLTAMLGYNVFEKASVPIAIENEILFCTSRDGAYATGYPGRKGFVVKQGSKISRSVTESMARHSAAYYALRIQLEKNGTINNGVFVIDYEFASPSAASSVVLGRSSNGRVDWKNTAVKPEVQTHDSDILYITGRSSNAQGHMNNDDSFVVHKGSSITPLGPTASCPSAPQKAFEDNRSKMNGFTLTEDIVFKTPSGASSFVLQASSNGYAEWHNKDGVALKDLIDR